MNEISVERYLESAASSGLIGSGRDFYAEFWRGVGIMRSAQVEKNRVRLKVALNRDDVGKIHEDSLQRACDLAEAGMSYGQICQALDVNGRIDLRLLVRFLYPARTMVAMNLLVESPLTTPGPLYGIPDGCLDEFPGEVGEDRSETEGDGAVIGSDLIGES